MEMSWSLLRTHRTLRWLVRNFRPELNIQEQQIRLNRCEPIILVLFFIRSGYTV